MYILFYLQMDLLAFEIFFWVLTAFLSSASENCRQNRIYQNLGPKTPYSYVANMDERPLIVDGNCSAVQFWLLARHGTRYAKQEGLDGIGTRLPELAQSAIEGGNLCQETKDLLREWSPPEWPADAAKRLHAEGEAELTMLAERFANRLPGLLSESYRRRDNRFLATERERAQRSQFFFATGLYGRHVASGSVYFEPPAEPHDPLIRFYKLCDRWKLDVKQSPRSLEERKRFEESDFFRDNLVTPLSEKLGQNKTISIEDLEAVYNGCIFEQAWHPGKPSTWCQVFTEEQMEMMEYREDLENYWQDGHGFPLNGEAACMLSNNALANFVNASTLPEAEEKGIFYFSHSGAVLKFFTHLNLFKGEGHLRHDNFVEMKGREWRSSKIDPFGANVAMVLKRCPDEGHSVATLVNERITPLPDCGGKLWCPLDEFSRLFGADCSLEEVCRVSEEERMHVREADDDKF